MLSSLLTSWSKLGVPMTIVNALIGNLLALYGTGLVKIKSSLEAGIPGVLPT